MIDTHAHLFYLKKPLEDVIKDAQNAGVTHIINIAVNLETSRQALAQATQFPKIISATCGIHPCDIPTNPDWAALEVIVEQNPVVAIGEIGLDYHHMRSPRDVQIKAFETQLKLAEKHGLPVIIHNRKADDDIKAIINTVPDIKKVLHCYSSSSQYATSVLNPNTFFSFTAMITHAKKGKTIQAIRDIPLEHIMIETDCPYLKPKGVDAAENEPAYVGRVLEKIAEVKKGSVIEIGAVIEQTSREFFEI